MVKLLELFGGIGAATKSLRNLGVEFETVDYVEVDPKAVASYNSIHDENFEVKEICGYSAPNVGVDVLVHGSPCQDFSIAGLKSGAVDGSRSGLMFETIRVIEEMGENKPKVVIWENVKNVLSDDMIGAFRKYLGEMSVLGYVNNYEVLNAMEFGVPQNRDRLFVVSVLNGEKFDFRKLNRFKPYNVRSMIEDRVSSKYVLTQPSMVGKIGKQGNGSSYLKEIQEFVWTITTKQLRCPNSGIVKIVGGQYRMLTERECWRFMGFTDEDFDKAHEANPSKVGKINATLYKQAGNSIVVPVIESILDQVVRMCL